MRHYIGRRYLRCPKCGRKRVTMRLRSNGEDHYGCDRCDFWVFADETYDESFVALREANPEATDVI